MTSEFPWRGSRLPRSMTALAMVMGVGALGLGGCLPSDGSDGRDARVTDEDIDEIVRRVEERLEPAPDPVPAFNLLAVTDADSLNVAELASTVDFGDWTDITAFYPNQATYQWVDGGSDGTAYSQGVHFGAGDNPMADSRPCLDCHADGSPSSLSEPDLNTGTGFDKGATKTVQARAAFDAERFYLHVRWDSETDAQGQDADNKEAGPTIAHQTFRWNGDAFTDSGIGKESDPEGNPIPPGGYDGLGENVRFNYEDRFAVMSVPAAQNLTDALGASFNAHGCFMACHDDLRNMPRDAGDEWEVGGFEADPIVGDAGMGRSDMRHYILNSRDTNGGNTQQLYSLDWPGDPADIDEYIQNHLGPDVLAGDYLDLWQGRMGRSVPMGHASADYVYHYRRNNNQEVQDFADENYAASGRANWFDNRPGDWDDPAGEAGFVRYIYDPDVTGFWALREENLAQHFRAFEGPLITEGEDTNAIDLADTDLFEWDGAQQDFVLQFDRGGHESGALLGADILAEGDLIPRRALRLATGARSTVRAFAAWEENVVDGTETRGTYNMVFVRDLVSTVDGDLVTDHDFDLEGGQTMAFGVFDDHSSNRGHHVTFPVGVVRQGQASTFLGQAFVDDSTPVIEAAENN